MSRGWCPIAALLLLPLSAVQRGESEGKGLCVVEFQSAVSREFLERRDVTVDHFTEELILQLGSSKVLEDVVEVVRGDSSLRRVLSAETRQAMHETSFCRDFWTLCRKDSSIRFYLVGRISDDTSNIMSVDAEIYKAYNDSRDVARDPLLARFHVEASPAEAFAHKASLGRYLVDQVVLQVEANLDDRIRVLILPLAFYGHDESVEHLGGMIASLIGNHLGVSQRIRVIMFDSMANAGWRRRPGEFRRWTLPELGRLEAAKYVIHGSFFKLDTSLGIEASHIDVETGHSVLSKSVMIKSLSGPTFYDEVGRLGNEMRRAIELDYDIKHGEKSPTISVVAVPPNPVTDENRAISTEIATKVAIMLRALDTKVGGTRLTVVTDQLALDRFVTDETENAIMGRDLNTKYLWIVRCERPFRDVNVRFEILDVKNPQRFNTTAQRYAVKLESLDPIVHSMVLDVLFNRLPFKFDSISTARAVMNVPLSIPGNTYGVVPLPPIPNTQQNRAISEDIANIVMTKLRVVEQRTAEIVVARTEDRFDDIFELRRFKVDSIAKEVNVRFLWLIEYKELGHGRYIMMRLVSATNPIEKQLFRNFRLGHIDDLNRVVGDNVRDMLIEWWPDRDSLGRTPFEPREESILSNDMEKTSYLTRSSSLRVRGILMGLRNDTREVFLGNPYRYAIEVAGIYHFEIFQTPFQAELSVTYDFGKKSSGRTVFGRYVTGLLRWNAGWDSFRDMRLYLGLGATLVNVVRVDNSALGSIVGGYTATAGIEIPFSRYVFLDLNFQHLQSSKPIRGTDDFPEGFATSEGIGCGIGFRLK